MDVQIDEVVTELVVTEPTGSLSREEMRAIVQHVVEHLNLERNRSRQREKDTAIRDRAYDPEGSDREE